MHLDLDEWSLAKNDEWIDDVAFHRADVQLASPEAGNRVRPTGEPTIFARELDRLRDNHGYVEAGDQLRPRPPGKGGGR